MKLVIVESPFKTKTIKQFLGDEFEVKATKGHIRDIANTGEGNLGIDFNNGFKPIYKVIEGQEQTINMLKSSAAKASNIYLATDPDREGEAISWHLNEVLDIENKEVKRIEFNEITKDAILFAIDHPREIDENLFHSQETRKIMDRVIGYKLSGLVKREVGTQGDGTASAGRVQSACLRMIADREKQIKDFEAETYYEIEASFTHFKAKLIDPIKKTIKTFKTIEECNEIISKLDKSFVVQDISIKEKKEYAPAPFKTADLMRQAVSKYSLSSKRVMDIAHKLYEGIEINGKHIALITYMRTDSTRLSEQFTKQLVSHIIDKYGKDNLGYAHSKEAKETDQLAHEAIRPVSLKYTPESIKEYLAKDQYKVYSLIYNRTIESHMKDEILEEKTVEFYNNGYIFQAVFTKPIYLGFKMNRENENEDVYEFTSDLASIKTIKKPVEAVKKSTKGPDRFSEATLIGEMEKSGIGRPSTYASTIETLKRRQYISLQKNKKIELTDDGYLTSLFLQKYFDNIINVEYTAEMEKLLDEIAEGDKREDEVAPEFYKSFMQTLSNINIEPLETGELCPICGSKMVYKVSKLGRFEACSNYPKCNYIKREEHKDENQTDIPCPECGSGRLVLRVAKGGKYKGQKFYGCSNYPNCKFTQTIK